MARDHSAQAPPSERRSTLQGVACWRIVGGPFEYYGSGEASGIAVGWAWDVDRGDEVRVIRVEIATRAAANLRFCEAERLLRSVLDEDNPPGRLVITPAGVERTSSSVDIRRSA